MIQITDNIVHFGGDEACSLHMEKVDGHGELSNHVYCGCCTNFACEAVSWIEQKEIRSDIVFVFISPWSVQRIRANIRRENRVATTNLYGVWIEKNNKTGTWICLLLGRRRTDVNQSIRCWVCTKAQIFGVCWGCL